MGLKIWGKHLIGNSTQPNCNFLCKLLPSFHKLLFFIALLITGHFINLPLRFMPPCFTGISMNLFHFIIELLLGPLECSSYFNVQSLRVVFKECIRFWLFHYNSRSQNLRLIWFDKLGPNMSCICMWKPFKFHFNVF